MEEMPEGRRRNIMTQQNSETIIPDSEKEKLISTWNKLWNKQAFRMLIGALGGAVLGALYWNFIGCNSGSCPLTNNPYKTVIFFTIMGAVFTRKSSDK